MEIYSELINSIEQGSSLEIIAANIKHKLIHYIETTKQEINLLKQQENLLQISYKYYNSMAKNFPDRVLFLNNVDNRSMCEIRAYSRPPMLVSTVAEAVSIFLNEKPRWNTFSQKLMNFRAILLGVDYDQLSEQTLYELGMAINANRNNANAIYNVSLAAANLFQWLLITYDWAITIRDKFPQFTSFKEIERLLNTEFIEQSRLEGVRSMIIKKEREIDLLERTWISINQNILNI